MATAEKTQPGTISINGSGKREREVAPVELDDELGESSISVNGRGKNETKTAADDEDDGALLGTIDVNGEARPPSADDDEDDADDAEESEAGESDEADEADDTADDDEDDAPADKAAPAQQRSEPAADDLTIDAGTIKELTDAIGQTGVDKVIKPLVERVNKLADTNRKLVQALQERDYETRVHTAIDKIGDPRLGTDSSDLTPKQQRARGEVRAIAETLYERAQKAKAPISGPKALRLAAQQWASNQKGGKQPAAPVKQRTPSPVPSRPSSSAPAKRSYRDAAAKVDQKLKRIRGE